MYKDYPLIITAIAIVDYDLLFQGTSRVELDKI